MLASAAPRHDVMPQRSAVAYRDPLFHGGTAKPVYGVRELPAAIAAHRHVDARSTCQILIESIGGLAWVNVSRRYLVPAPGLRAR